MQPAARTASSPGLAPEDPSLTSTAPSAGSSGRRGFRRDPAVRPEPGEEAGTQGGPQARASPHSRRGVRMQTHPRWAPQHSTRASLWNPHPHSGGDKGAQEELPGAGARSPRGPGSEREAGEVQPLSRGADPPTPRLRDPRDTHRCGAAGLAGPRGPVLLGPCTRPARPQLLSAPVAGGSWEDSPHRGLRLTAAEALLSRRSGGRELRPRGPPAGAGPHLPRAVGHRGRLPPRRKLTLQPRGCHYHHRPARSASRPNAVIGRVAALLGPRSRGESSQPSALPARVPPGSARAAATPLVVT